MNPREHYIQWRLSQGFTQEQAEIIHDCLDATDVLIEKRKTFLSSSLNENCEEITKSIEVIKLMNEKLYSHSDKHAFMRLFFPINVGIRGTNTAYELAKSGRYSAAKVMLRSSIEATLRMIFNTIKNSEEDFEHILSRAPDWEDALKTGDYPDNALALSPLCRNIDRLQLAKPIDNVFKHLKIYDLNYESHSNVTTLSESESNFLKSRLPIFDKEKWGEFCSLLVKFHEFYTIIHHNLLSEISGKFIQILYPGIEYDPDLYPHLTKLLLG